MSYNIVMGIVDTIGFIIGIYCIINAIKGIKNSNEIMNKNYKLLELVEKLLNSPDLNLENLEDSTLETIKELKELLK